MSKVLPIHRIILLLLTVFTVVINHPQLQLPQLSFGQAFKKNPLNIAFAKKIPLVELANASPKIEEKKEDTTDNSKEDERDVLGSEEVATDGQDVAVGSEDSSESTVLATYLPNTPMTTFPEQSTSSNTISSPTSSTSNQTQSAPASTPAPTAAPQPTQAPSTPTQKENPGHSNEEHGNSDHQKPEKSHGH